MELEASRISLAVIAQSAPAIVGGFFAAWYGARIGFNKTRRERSFEKKLAWHEETVRALTAYEEALNALENNSLNDFLITARKNKAASKPSDPPKTFRPSLEVWERVASAELRVRECLALHRIYTEDDVSLHCDIALNKLAIVVSRNWFDISATPEVGHAGTITKRTRLRDLRSILEANIRSLLHYSGLIERYSPRLFRRMRLWNLQRKLRLAKASEAKVVKRSSDPAAKRRR